MTRPRWTLLIAVFLAVLAVPVPPAVAALSPAPILQANTASQELDIMFVLDVSGSMTAYSLPSNLPPELALIQAQIAAIQNDPEYLRRALAVQRIINDPEVIAAQESFEAAQQALDDWVFDNYGIALDLVFDQVNSFGCNAGRSVEVLFADSYSSVTRVLREACSDEGVTISAEQLAIIEEMVPYIEDEEYQLLRTAIVEREAEYNRLLLNKGLNQAQSNLAVYAEQAGLVARQNEFATIADEIGFRTRLDLAIDAVKAFTELSRLDTLLTGRNNPIGIVTFSDVADYTYQTSTNYDAILAAADEIEPVGATNIADGVLTAISQLSRRGNEREHAIILLSDGYANVGLTGSQLSRRVPALARQNDIRICSVGVGNTEDEIDIELLQAMADETDGTFSFTSSGTTLSSIFAECRQTLLGQQVLQFTGQSLSGQVVDAGRLSLPGDASQVTLTLSHAEGRPNLEILDPSGRVINLGDANVRVQQSENFQIVVIDNPPPGEWLLRIDNRGTTLNQPTEYNLLVAAQQGESAGTAPAGDTPAQPADEPESGEQADGPAPAEPDEGEGADADGPPLLMIGLGLFAVGLAVLIVAGAGVWWYMRRRSGNA